MKYEWRKSEKEFYFPKAEPEIKIIPAANFFSISGKGNPNHPLFSEKISALYSLSYAIRMMPKNGYQPDGYFVYTVYPLEGIWDFEDEEYEKEGFSKDNLIYNIMIKQPPFVDQSLLERAKDILISKKKDTKFTKDVVFTSFKNEKVVQMMHNGPFETESETFAIMESYIEEKNLTRAKTSHREIYLKDFKKTAPEKLKTVLRYLVK